MANLLLPSLLYHTAGIGISQHVRGFETWRRRQTPQGKECKSISTFRNRATGHNEYHIATLFAIAIDPKEEKRCAWQRIACTCSASVENVGAMTKVKNSRCQLQRAQNQVSVCPSPLVLQGTGHRKSVARSSKFLLERKPSSISDSGEDDLGPDEPIQPREGLTDGVS